MASELASCIKDSRRQGCFRVCRNYFVAGVIIYLTVSTSVAHIGGSPVNSIPATEKRIDMDNIAKIDGMDAMFCVGTQDSAWHRLGQRTPNAATWQEAMTLAKLDWPVVLKDLYSRDTQGQVQQVKGYKSVWRGNGSPAVLGIVGDGFTPIQNAQAFDFVDSLLQAQNGAHYESAGALGLGETIWVLARVPGADIRIQNTDDLSQSYLLVATGHAGNLSYMAKLTSVRVVCQNTLNMALSHAGSVFKVKHTKSAETRLTNAKSAMAGIIADSKSLGEKLNTLATRRLTKDTMLAVVNRLFPENTATENQGRRNAIVLKVLELFESNDKNAIPAIRGTAYNLLNAVTEYTDHHRTARLTAGKAGMTVEQARAEAAIFGTGDRLKSDALVAVMEETVSCPVGVMPVQAIHTDDATFLRSLGIRN